MFNMKHLVQIACTAALISASSYSYAAQNGINYDPAHSKAYNVAQHDYNGPNGVRGMTDAINNDLMQIKNTLKFNTIKTYFSKYCNIPTGQCVPIAQLATAAGLQVLLGVYEFEPRDGCHDNSDCIAWTKSQVDQAITSANAPSSTVIGIVVGNEDMYDSSGKEKVDLQQRIVVDIAAIKDAVSVPVTTAQRQGDWCGGTANGCDPARKNSINQTNPFNILGTIDVIGANIFPYWGGSPEKVNGVSVASATKTTVMDLKIALRGKGVIVTEEGWPSCSNPPAQHPTTIDDEIDYFHTWSTQANQDFDSYYFQAYDLAEQIACGRGEPSGDADKHFGLCAVSGVTKDSRLIGCK